MMITKVFKFTLVIILFFTFGFSSNLFSESVTFTAEVDGTSVIFNGFTSPNSLVMFIENDSVKGTTVSDSLGAYTKKFTAQDDGLHIFSIYSIDPENNETAIFQKEIYLIAFQTTEVNDVLLPPSIAISETTYTKGQNIIISGYSKPGQFIELKLIGSSENIYIVVANSVGYYESLINTNLLQPGSYRLIGSIQNPANSDILKTIELTFVLANSPVNPNPPANEIPISNPIPIESDPLICEYPYYRLCSFDFGNAGYIDLQYGLVSFINGFIRYFKQPISNVFDINNDKVVDSKDLSIVLYYAQKDSESGRIVNSEEQNASTILKWCLVSFLSLILFYNIYCELTRRNAKNNN